MFVAFLERFAGACPKHPLPDNRGDREAVYRLWVGDAEVDVRLIDIHVSYHQITSFCLKM